MNAALGGVSPREIAEILGRVRRETVWVLGDLMLDEYVEGLVERTSPEAPVPVVRARSTSYRLGGAANVAHACRALGATVVLGGVVGDDEAGGRLLDGCRAAGIDVRAVARDPSRPTCRKVRVIAHNQQILRLDWETTSPVAPHVCEQVLAALAESPRPGTIILSDYAKGMLTDGVLERAIAGARAAGAAVVVDPKGRSFARYAGASLLTPNLGELEIAAGERLREASDEAIAAAAERVLGEAGAGAMVVTMGERGMIVAPRGGPAQRIATTAREVFDVTGAGDTVTATLALACAAGAPLPLGAALANIAAGIVVGKLGTAVVTAGEIAGAIAAPRAGDKLLSEGDLVERAALWRLSGRRVVLTNGCFDLLHAGHLALLREAASLGDVLVVALNDDASVRRLKGPGRPLIEAAERAALLGAFGFVDAVTLFAEDTPLGLIERVRPDVLVKGGDYRIDQVVGREVVEAGGGRVVLVPVVPDRATSGLVDRIRKGEA